MNRVLSGAYGRALQEFDPRQAQGCLPLTQGLFKQALGLGMPTKNPSRSQGRRREKSRPWLTFISERLAKKMTDNPEHEKSHSQTTSRLISVIQKNCQLAIRIRQWMNPILRKCSHLRGGNCYSWKRNQLVDYKGGECLLIWSRLTTIIYKRTWLSSQLLYRLHSMICTSHLRQLGGIGYCPWNFTPLIPTSLWWNMVADCGLRATMQPSKRKLQKVIDQFDGQESTAQWNEA